MRAVKVTTCCASSLREYLNCGQHARSRARPRGLRGSQSRGRTERFPAVGPGHLSFSRRRRRYDIGPALEGFGATLAQWKAAHTLDLSVPERNTYLPRVAGSGGEDTWQVVTVAGGPGISYTLNVAPSSLRPAEERARQELPADARVLWRHTFGDTCAQEQFRSATLAAALGDGIPWTHAGQP